MFWQTSRFKIPLNRPHVMGIVNVTPDSFSDGGAFSHALQAIAHCDALVEQGVDILDIGGESTRPGALPVPMEIELARVLPVLRHALTLGVAVSVDTYKPQVMKAVLDMGADIINDVWALRWNPDGLAGENGVSVIAAHPNCGVCLMHMQGEPQSMQKSPMQGDVLSQVSAFLSLHAQKLQQAGVASERICVDPGIGFGKTPEQNFSLLAHQQQLAELGFPVLAGWSRKSSLAFVAQLGGADRTVVSVTAALLAVQNGAHIVRVHDVAATVQALSILKAMKNQQKK